MATRSPDGHCQQSRRVTCTLVVPETRSDFRMPSLKSEKALLSCLSRKYFQQRSVCPGAHALSWLQNQPLLALGNVAHSLSCFAVAPPRLSILVCSQAAGSSSAGGRSGQPAWCPVEDGGRHGAKEPPASAARPGQCGQQPSHPHPVSTGGPPGVRSAMTTGPLGPAASGPRHGGASVIAWARLFSLLCAS